MSNRVNPPKQLVLPQSVSENQDLKKAFDDRDYILFQMWRRMGGGDDVIDGLSNGQVDVSGLLALLSQVDDLSSDTSDANEITPFDFGPIESELGFTDDPQLANTESIESELGFGDDPVVVVDESIRNVVSTAVDYTTVGSDIVKCTASLTITLNATPDDQEMATISITNGNVKIDGNGKNIDADTDVTIAFADIQQPAVVDCLYLADFDEWIIK